MEDKLNEKLSNMTNYDVARILKSYLRDMKIPRGSTKSMQLLFLIAAMNKAIFVLENTPNEEECNKDIVYYDEDAIKFIHSRSDLNRDVINKVLELELEYMKSIGLVYEIEKR